MHFKLLNVKLLSESKNAAESVVVRSVTFKAKKNRLPDISGKAV